MLAKAKYDAILRAVVSRPARWTGTAACTWTSSLGDRGGNLAGVVKAYLSSQIDRNTFRLRMMGGLSRIWRRFECRRVERLSVSLQHRANVWPMESRNLWRLPEVFDAWPV